MKICFVIQCIKDEVNFKNYTKIKNFYLKNQIILCGYK